MKKKIPTFKTDGEAERFVDTADLSDYCLSGLKPVRFEFEKKAQLKMRALQTLFKAVKKRSAVHRILYTRFIREAVESALARPEKARCRCPHLSVGGVRCTRTMGTSSLRLS